ncbi:hypothetical protein ABMA28_004763 [Loxostege sticticalis]
MKKNLKLMTSEDKVQYSKGVKVKPKSKPLTKGKVNKQVTVNKKINLLSKSGRIIKKCKKKLRLVNNILKSELLISDTEKKTLNFGKNKSLINNNVIGISDHNQTGNKSDSDNHRLKIQKNKQIITKVRKGLKSNNLSRPVDLHSLVNVESVFECDYCSKTFSTKKLIERHIYGHLNLKPFKCQHCSKKFRYDVNMQVHIMRLHSDESLEEYMCHICEKVFLFKETLNSHLTNHVRKANFFKCVLCEKKYSESSQLTRHEKTHLQNGRYQCPMCDMNYGLRNHFEAHLKGHSKIKDYICQFCGKEFLRLNSMHRHVQVCHGGHRIQCPICKKKLKGHLTEHMRTHDKKRPHECPKCKQRFTQSTQLNVHMRSHTGDRPYPCRICGRRFSHSNALMLHIRRHTGEKPFPCAMCPLTFSQLPHMKAHMRNIHGKENAYKCTKCAQFFKLKVDLERHVKMCTVGDKKLSFEEKIQSSVQYEEVEVESVMSLSRMRYLLALLLTMIATKDKLKYLGFNKRLIDDLLMESLEAMDLKPCKDESLSEFKRLKVNIEMFLDGTVPGEQMEKLKEDNKTTEEILELLTDEKKVE